MTDPRPALSVVAPCYNEEGVLPEFLGRVGVVLDRLGGTAEIVVVDDGSRDGTWETMTRAAARDPRLVAVRLMRNHGHQLALTAGLTICRGERVLIIDADLQDPPELLPEMMALMDGGDGKGGADVVYGQRRAREGESLFKRATAAAFYRLIGRMTDVEIPLDAGDFRLMTRRVLDVLLAMPERHRFIRGMVAWIGGRQVPIRYDRQPRAAGESKYPLGKMIRFAADAITAFSVVPLMASMTIGWIMAAVGFAFVVYSVVGWLLGYNLPGWTSLMAAIGVLGGMQFLMLGIIGAYLGRLYDQSKGRPLFMIREIVGGPGERPEMSAEFDKHAARYDGGLDNPVKKMMGDADSFIAVKARWLLRHEPGLKQGDLGLLDYGCGAGDLMRVLAGQGARGAFTGCDVSTGMLDEAAKRWPAAAGPAPALRAQEGARTPFADGQFDIATISAVLHHVPVEDRPAVYAELGRVLKPGGRLYVFEHNPRNPLVRHVIARTPIDENAILLDANEVQEGLLGAGRYELETDYLMFMPPGLAFLRFVDRALAWLPLGAQYAVAARKPA